MIKQRCDDRITHYDEHGNPYFLLGNIVVCNAVAAKLAEYEDLDLNPSHLKETLDQTSSTASDTSSKDEQTGCGRFSPTACLL